MAILLTFGNTHKGIYFGTGVPLIEHGQRKYAAAWLEDGVVKVGKKHSTLQKIFDWIDFESENYTHNQDIRLERLTLTETEFFYKLLCEFREDDTTIGGKFYDAPLSENQKRQLDEAIPITKRYLEARLNGHELQMD
jgi:hypothetical protein